MKRMLQENMQKYHEEMLHTQEENINNDQKNILEIKMWLPKKRVHMESIGKYSVYSELLCDKTWVRMLQDKCWKQMKSLRRNIE